MNFRVLFACGMAALFGACASDDTEKYPEASLNPKEVSFRIHQELTTRGGKAAFEEGDAIGIYVMKHGASDAQLSNVKWVYREGTWEPATPADKVLWAQDGSALDFYAYYPYATDAAEPLAMEFAVNTDVLRAANNGGMTDGEVELAFAHAFAMVEVEIDGGNVTLLPELKVLAKGVKTAMAWNIVENVFTDSETEATSADFEAVEEGSFTFGLVLAPQEIAAGVPFLQCENGEVVYIYTPKQPINLEAGKKQTITITLN